LWRRRNKEALQLARAFGRPTIGILLTLIAIFFKSVDHNPCKLLIFKTLISLDKRLFEVDAK